MKQNNDLIFVGEDEIDPNEHIVVTYRIRLQDNDKDLKLHDALSLLAFDPTIGTWTDSVRTTDGIIDQFCGKVLYPLPPEQDQGSAVRIAIPAANIDPVDGGIPQLLAILGVPFTLKAITHLRLTDLSLPISFIDALPRPRYGVEGMYQSLAIPSGRPILATMLKPRVGLPTSQYVADARDVLLGGVDVILDDEVMGSSAVSPVRERTREMKKITAEVEQLTGEKKMYVPNATTSVARLGALALELQELGADALYVNPITLGFSALELLRAIPELRLPLLCCRAMHGVYTRSHDHGISMYVLLKLARLCGADAMHVGSVKGKIPHNLVGDPSQVQANIRALRGRMRHTAPALPIVSGGLHPGNVAWTVEKLGRELIIQAGSGVVGHPAGPRAGARALRRVAEGVCRGEPLLEIAEEDAEVKAAFRAWGYVVGDEVLAYESRTDQKQQQRLHLEALIKEHQANLQKLELKIAHYGGLTNAPLEVWNSLETTKRAIDHARSELEHV